MFVRLQSLPCYYHHGSFEEASREHNREKNRYPNILPCEWHAATEHNDNHFYCYYPPGPFHFPQQGESSCIVLT